MLKLSNNQLEPRFPFVLLSDCEVSAQLIPAQFLPEFNLTGLLIYENTMEIEQRRKKLPNLISLVRRPDFFFFGLIAFLKEMRWKRIAMVSEFDSYFEEVEQN